MRNAVIRKRAIALWALANFPVRIVLGASMLDANLEAVQESRLWAVPTPTFGATK